MTFHIRLRESFHHANISVGVSCRKQNSKDISTLLRKAFLNPRKKKPITFLMMLHISDLHTPVNANDMLFAETDKCWKMEISATFADAHMRHVRIPLLATERCFIMFAVYSVNIKNIYCKIFVHASANRLLSGVFHFNISQSRFRNSSDKQAGMINFNLRKNL